MKNFKLFLLIILSLAVLMSCGAKNQNLFVTIDKNAELKNEVIKNFKEVLKNDSFYQGLNEKQKEYLDFYLKSSIDLLDQKQLLNRSLDIESFLIFTQFVYGNAIDSYFIFRFLGIDPYREISENFEGLAEKELKKYFVARETQKIYMHKKSLYSQALEAMRDPETKQVYQKSLDALIMQNYLNEENLKLYLKNKLIIKDFIKNLPILLIPSAG